MEQVQSKLFSFVAYNVSPRYVVFPLRKLSSARKKDLCDILVDLNSILVMLAINF